MSSARVLGLVVARGGSVGLPRKNVLPLCGKPLIVYTIEAALGARTLERTILSSDDAEIIAVARAAGCAAPFVRPAELAGDRSSTVDVALHALDWLESHEGWRADVVVMLPATAPLRRAEHIDGAVTALLEDTSSDAVVGVTEADYPPYWMLSIDEGRLKWIFPEGGLVDHRQDLPPAYRPNGSIYAIKAATLRAERTFYPRERAPFVMPRESSVNIDALVDFRLAEALMRDAAR
ncbi:MAG TPA: acylneuraminate cytidylyltransferase family protein [Methylomirabilota bacterium]|nr:acylneuraminate cytidylyltransferase family protein [Methylomirabilota bacterium]